MIRTLALVLLLTTTAIAAPGERAICTTGEVRCFAHLRTAAAAFAGYTPADLQAAYAIDPAISGAPVVAVVDAFGYADLESDLATYRATFGLPACTVASGCLTILNQQGATSPLPAEEASSANDWTVETALDVQAVSAVCPRCKLVVVQADDTTLVNLLAAHAAAIARKPAVTSASWGGTESGDLTADEQVFDNPGIAQFASSGDSGWDDGGMGPLYPSTSAHTIAVGGTSLVPAANARGWSETAWGSGGSSCSASVARPAYQVGSPCAFRAASDLSAVGDPNTGLRIFNSHAGGWVVVGGTSAASPLVAAMFAATGNGAATLAQIAAANIWTDVTAGSNGACGNALCTAGPGWDGPTGLGTPNGAALMAGSGSGSGSDPAPAVAITAPADGATVSAGFSVVATAGASAVEVGLYVDGMLAATATAAPYVLATSPFLTAGAHTLDVVAADAADQQARVEIHVEVALVTIPGGDDGSGAHGGGCSASDSGGGDAAPWWLIVVMGVAWSARGAGSRQRGTAATTAATRPGASGRLGSV